MMMYNTVTMRGATDIVICNAMARRDVGGGVQCVCDEVIMMGVWGEVLGEEVRVGASFGSKKNVAVEPGMLL